MAEDFGGLAPADTTGRERTRLPFGFLIGTRSVSQKLFGVMSVPTGESNIVAIVDDDGDVRDVLDALLEQAGHAVRTFNSGEQLLNDAELADIACLVVDQRMPGMTGLDLLRTLDQSGRTIPSLLITGAPDADLDEEARRLGAIEVFAKPIDFTKLLQLVGYAVQ
jgi:FixJ family two-component response regulator